jgi:hypothetical protein
MKKLLLVLAVAGFVACNNEKKEGEKTESTATQQTTVTETPKPDTTKPAQPVADTTKK